tara:strand:- start:23 stop:256 length:234 start_codon:yes stop_codon:yes gene_type:complete
MAVYKGRQARGPAGQSFINSLAMSLLGVNMHLSEIITSLNGLRYELEKQNDYDPQHFRSYYCEVIAEALTVLVDLDR